MTDYIVKGLAAPDMTSAAFVAALRDAGSPVSGAEAEAVFAYCAARRFSPAALLAWFRHESSFGTQGWAAKTKSWGNTRPPSFARPGIGQFNQDTGVFYRVGVTAPPGRYLTAYATWSDGGVATVARFLDHAPYQGKDTVQAIVPIWAPASDGNSVDVYVATVLAAIACYAAPTPPGPTKETSMGHVPQPPITQHPITKVIGVGRDPDLQRAPKFTVLHSMAGTLKGTDGYFPQPTTAALTDFGIGQVDTGNGYAQIIRWNDPFGSQIGWASGPVRVPEGDGPRILAAFGGAAGLNRYGVAIEHDDTTRADGTIGAVAQEPVTSAQWSATCWLQAFIHAEWLQQTAATYDLNAWHLEFCGRAYKTCPNPRITDHVDEYQAAVKAIMAHWQDGTPYPAGGVVVNGLRLAVPTNTGTPPVPPVTPLPADDTVIVTPFINDAGEPCVTLNYRGKAKRIIGVNIADAGVSVIGMDDATYDRSIRQNAGQPYTKRPA